MARSNAATPLTNALRYSIAYLPPKFDFHILMERVTVDVKSG